jgi:hypothetical protein
VSKPKREQRRWQPLQLSESTNPERYAQYGITPPDRVYGNDLYSVFVRDMGHGALHISLHRRNRAPVRDWRHFQAIKNEVAGPERLAIEVFPPESLLTDQSNEYHLWVLPPGAEADFPFLIPGTADNVMTQQEGDSKYGRLGAKQRDWQPGIPTGKGRNQI